MHTHLQQKLNIALLVRIAVENALTRFAALGEILIKVAVKLL